MCVCVLLYMHPILVFCACEHQQQQLPPPQNRGKPTQKRYISVQRMQISSSRIEKKKHNNLGYMRTALILLFYILNANEKKRRERKKMTHAVFIAVFIIVSFILSLSLYQYICRLTSIRFFFLLSHKFYLTTTGRTMYAF